MTPFPLLSVSKLNLLQGSTQKLVVSLSFFQMSLFSLYLCHPVALISDSLGNEFLESIDIYLPYLYSQPQAQYLG